jgi:predicted regulator of Ras-like GTPase activity (Roadblock/LC7/MglB family)
MSSEREFQAVLAHLEQDVEGFIAAAFVDFVHQKRLASHCVTPSFDQESAFGAAFATLRSQATTEFDAPEEIIVTSRDWLHFYLLLSGSVAVIVTAKRTATTIALMQLIVRRAVEKISVPQALAAPPPVRLVGN